MQRVDRQAIVLTIAVLAFVMSAGATIFRNEKNRTEGAHLVSPSESRDSASGAIPGSAAVHDANRNGSGSPSGPSADATVLAHNAPTDQLAEARGSGTHIHETRLPIRKAEVTPPARRIVDELLSGGLIGNSLAESLHELINEHGQIRTLRGLRAPHSMAFPFFPEASSIPISLEDPSHHDRPVLSPEATSEGSFPNARNGATTSLVFTTSQPRESTLLDQAAGDESLTVATRRSDTDDATPANPPPPGANEATVAFYQLLEQMWQTRLRESPLFATSVGVHEYGHLLPRNSLADYERRYQAKQSDLAQLLTIDRGQLSTTDQVNYDILQRQLEEGIASYGFSSHLLPITNRSGFHVSLAAQPNREPLVTVQDYENYLARLAAVPQYFADHLELMRAGIEQGLVLPDVILTNCEDAIVAHVVDDPLESVFYKPLLEMPERFPQETQERLCRQAALAISDSVVPAYREFLEFMREEYVPAARGSIAASALPGGRAFYRHRVQVYTTLEITPDEVHQIGLREVARIIEEMEGVIRSTGFEGDRAAFVEFLRNDPQFYAETPEELMRHVALVLKRMDGQLPRLFSHLPRAPYGIRKVPDFEAPNTTTAYYMRPNGDGTRAGFYYVNTYDLSSRPLYELEALSLHEAVPGHHLQIALQQELEDLPLFRRYAGFTVFSEGWALYAERLGREVGFYEDPYSDYGRLSYEMWRACRLVVDTGMHYFGWTRQQAIEYLLEHTALTEHNVRSEIDRYIAWPGQALAYKIGELKIRHLREVAEERLGDQFDIRQFHHVVLRDGAVPLEVLEANVQAWLEEIEVAGEATTLSSDSPSSSSEIRG